jgi:ABC-type transport system involved in cytochrome c biogenesis permease subunit
MLITLAYALLWLALLAYFFHARSAGRLIGRAATGAAVAAWALLAGGLVERGLAAGHWPLTNAYEVALGLAWTTIAVYLLMEATWRERRAGVYVLPIALLAATYAVTRPAGEQAIGPLLPALRSAWLPVHVASALVGYGAFGVAAGFGVARWRAAGDAPGQEVERAMERAVALGFPWLTLSILAGAIWAQAAWGRYWGWDPKETWALVTWLWYLLFLHLRPQPGWRGRRLAGLAIAGLGIVIFTFVGVPWLVRTVRLESLHGF